MTDCLSCTKKGKERSLLLDKKRVEAKKQANEQKKTMAIYKLTKEGEFLICEAESAFENKYIIVDVISHLF